MMIMLMFIMAYFPFLPFLCSSLPSKLMYRWILGTVDVENAVSLQLCNMSCLFMICVSFSLAYCSSPKWEMENTVFLRKRFFLLSFFFFFSWFCWFFSPAVLLLQLHFCFFFPRVFASALLKSQEENFLFFAVCAFL